MMLKLYSYIYAGNLTQDGNKGLTKIKYDDFGHPIRCRVWDTSFTWNATASINVTVFYEDFGRQDSDGNNIKDTIMGSYNTNIVIK